jgi:hypothetical protein
VEEGQEDLLSAAEPLIAFMYTSSLEGNPEHMFQVRGRVWVVGGLAPVDSRVVL